MPLQCDICECIRAVPMLLDMLTLRRNKFRDPRFMGTRRVNVQMWATQEGTGRSASAHNTDPSTAMPLTVCFANISGSLSEPDSVVHVG